MPGSLPHRRHHPHRVRLRLRAARYLQRLRLLRRELPFGVIDRNQDDGRAWKCTLCYDRQRDGLEPACAKACPTDSIQFGEVSELRAIAERRVEELHARGVTEAYLYGADAAEQPGTEGLNAFFLLVDRPEVYHLPKEPVCPTKTAGSSWISAALASIGILAAAIGAVRSTRS